MTHHLHYAHDEPDDDQEWLGQSGYGPELHAWCVDVCAHLTLDACSIHALAPAVCRQVHWGRPMHTSLLMLGDLQQRLESTQHARYPGRETTFVHVHVVRFMAMQFRAVVQASQQLERPSSYLFWIVYPLSCFYWLTYLWAVSMEVLAATAARSVISFLVILWAIAAVWMRVFGHIDREWMQIHAVIYAVLTRMILHRVHVLEFVLLPNTASSGVHLLALAVVGVIHAEYLVLTLRPRGLLLWNVFHLHGSIVFAIHRLLA